MKRVGRIFRVRGGASVATRLAAAAIALSMAALLVATIVGLRSGSELGNDIVDDQVAALEGSTSLQVQNRVRSVVRSTGAFAASPMTPTAIERFDTALSELDEIPGQEITREASVVADALRERYVDPLRASVDSDAVLSDVAPTGSAGAYLQFHYAADVDVELLDPADRDDALDGSAWSEAHRELHPIYREIAGRSNFFDLLLVEPDEARVVYSVEKRPDLGTSLRSGPFSGSALAAQVRQVIGDPRGGPVLGDFAFYDPAIATSVAVVAAPVVAAGRLAGVMVAEFSIDSINALVTAGGDWEGAGFPDSAQTYLLGSDGRMRSDDRAFVEDPESYVSSLREAGLITPDDERVIAASGTTALVVPVDDTTRTAALEATPGPVSGPNIINLDAIRSVRKLDLDGVDWWLVSEIQTAPAESNVDDFRKTLLVGAALFITAMAFLAMAWARGLMRPVRAISDRLGSDMREEAATAALPTRTPVEFRELDLRFEKMTQAIESEEAALARARSERLDLLRHMLPTTVASRIAAGDLESVQEVPDATVGVLTVTGLGDAVRADDSASSRPLVEEIHRVLDALAAEQGLERVKILGDAYFTACGHDRPYLDHAPRTAAFALGARTEVRRLGMTHGADLDISGGIATGPVTVGMAGGQRLLYDVWGDTASEAHLLARRASSGRVALSTATRDRLTEDLAERLQPDGDHWLLPEESDGAVS